MTVDVGCGSAAAAASAGGGWTLTSSLSHVFRCDWIAWSSKYRCSSAVLAALRPHSSVICRGWLRAVARCGLVRAEADL